MLLHEFKDYLKKKQQNQPISAEHACATIGNHYASTAAQNDEIASVVLYQYVDVVINHVA